MYGISLFRLFINLLLLFLLFSIKSKIQLRNLSVPTENLFARKSFNQPSRYQNIFQRHASTLFKPTIFCISVIIYYFFKNISKLKIFFIKVSSGAIVLAAIIQYERLQSNAKIHSRLQNLYNISKFGQQKTVSIIITIIIYWYILKLNHICIHIKYITVKKKITLEHV
jgi:hypothetical protein